MSCLSVLECSQYVDGALDSKHHNRVREHLKSCPACDARIQHLSFENVALRSALAYAPEGTPPVEIPELVPQPRLPATLTWLAVGLLACWAVSFGWSTASATLVVPNWLSWLLPGSVSTGVEFVFDVARRLFNAQSAWLSTVITGGLSLMLLLGCFYAMSLLGRRRQALNPSLCLIIGMLALTITAAPNSHAFELRHDEKSVRIAADEVIDDSLVLSAERVVVEGKVTGDLIVLGERVRVLGEVGGSVISAAEELMVEGSIEGNLVAAGEMIDVESASIGGNVYSVGETISLRANARVLGNVLLAGETLDIYALVGKDLITVGSEATLHGPVKGNVRVYGEELELTEQATIAGDLSALLADEQSVTMAPTASVAGESSVKPWPKDEHEDSLLESILGVVLKILAAALCALLLFWLFPSLREVAFFGAADGVMTSFLGAIALVATPVLALVLVITLIGAPIGFSAFLLWLVSLYLCGLVAANYVGNQLLGNPEQGWIKPLLLGVVLVIGLINVPFVGDLVRLVVMIAGAGLLVRWVRDSWAVRYR